MARKQTSGWASMVFGWSVMNDSASRILDRRAQVWREMPSLVPGTDDANGDPIAATFQVNDFETGDQLHPRVSADDVGNFVVTWQTNHVYTTTTSVFAQRFDADGIEIGSEFRVDGFMGANMENPSVAMNADGAFVIVFEAEGGFTERLYTRRQQARRNR